MSKGLIWVTRSQPGADATANKLQALGYSVRAAPLIKIVPVKDTPPAPSEGAVLIFTSGHGVRMFCRQIERRAWHVVTVGDATAKLALAHGFENVQSASGTADDIPSVISAAYVGRPIVHCSGSFVRGGFLKTLAAQGHDTDRQIWYEQVPVLHNPVSDVEAFSHIVFHSPLAAKTFANFGATVQGLVSVSISKATDQALGALEFCDRLVAEEPTAASVLSLL